MHDQNTLLFELFAVFVAAKVMGEVFERLRLPAVLGEIIAGPLWDRTHSVSSIPATH